MRYIKPFFYQWYSNTRSELLFKTRATGPKHVLRFLCQVRDDGIFYVADGNSTNKNDAGRIDETNASDLPANAIEQAGALPERNIPSKTVSVSQSSQGLEDVDLANRNRFVDRAQQRAQHHGYWELGSAKEKLNEFKQMCNIQAEYKFQASGPDHARSFVAEKELFVKQLNRTITARGTGRNKQAASRSCALSLLRQLTLSGVIQPFSGKIKLEPKYQVPKIRYEVPPYKVALAPEMVTRLEDCLNQLELQPVNLNFAPNNDEVIDLLLPSDDIKPDHDRQLQTSSVIPWSPPQQNWNPWTGRNIDEGNFATTDLDQLSDDLMKAYHNRLQNDNILRDMMEFRSKLPMHDRRNDLMNLINNNQVIIIRGNTGCGKTTQIAQFILEDYTNSGKGAYCNIVVTQPRRISAISVAERIAAERNEPIGQSIGYSVRFETILPRPFGSILFCTTGVLLRKLEQGLRGVSHVIVDEIHMRDVNSDFLLVVLRDMIRTYPDLRVILMSATIDTSLFSSYFGNCPVIEIEGRAHPVKQYFLEDCIEMTKFKPPPDSQKRKQENDSEMGLSSNDSGENLNKCVSGDYSPETIETMGQLSETEPSFELIEALLVYIRNQNTPGGVLVFLPSWNVIFGLMKHLQNSKDFSGSDYIILPCHSQVPRKDQQKVFEPVPPGVRKIILSTNIAETSITIDDIVYVIDLCKSRTKLFSSRNNMTSFETVWASKTNLEQRKGRAGRVKPGTCFTLCSKARFENLEEHMKPEIFRTPLHELALNIKLLELGDIGEFLSKVIEPPPSYAVREAENMLRDLKCLDSHDNLTSLGRILARLPIEPRLGKMMILGCVFGVGDTLAALTTYSNTSSDIFTLDPDENRLNDRQKALSGQRYSDHAAAVVALDLWQIAQRNGKYEEIRFCREEGLHMSTLRTMYKEKRQLIDLLMRAGFPEDCVIKMRTDQYNPDPTLDLAIGLLCMGLYPNVCYHKKNRNVLTAESKAARIHKTSVNCSSMGVKFPYPFFIFGEKVQSGAVSCKQLTMVSPLHLLLFGSRNVDAIDKKTVRLDNWLIYEMDAYHASLITALRPAIEQLIISSSESPDNVLNLDPAMTNLVQIVKDLCVLHTGDFEISREIKTTLQDGEEIY